MKMDWNKLVVALIATCPVVALAQNTPADPVAEYEQLLRDISGLQARNALVQRQIQQQQQELTDLRGAIEQVPALEDQLPPLLITMVDGLEQFVDLDLPFLQEEREERIANLRLLIEENLSDAQKLRRILEAWSIEVEYGNSFQTEQHPVTLPDGSERNADIVVLGRIGLMFQSADDEALTGLWDPATRAWVILGSEHRNPVRTAIRMARNQVAPDLTLLPVPAPAP